MLEAMAFGTNQQLLYKKKKLRHILGSVLPPHELKQIPLIVYELCVRTYRVRTR